MPCSTGCAPRASIPEQADFRTWRADLLSAYRSLEASEQLVAPARRPDAPRHRQSQPAGRHDLGLRERHRTARSRKPLQCADAASRARPSIISPRASRCSARTAGSGCTIPSFAAHLAARSGAPRRAAARRRDRRGLPAAGRRRGDLGRASPPASPASTRTAPSIVRPHGADRRPRHRLRHGAAARRPDHGHLRRRHRHGQGRARAGRAERGARGRRHAEERLHPPRLLRAALAAHQHHRLRAAARRSRASARSTTSSANIPATSCRRATALLAIVNDILDLATIDAGIMELDLAEVDIAATVAAAIEGRSGPHRRSRHPLETDIPPGIGGFVADGKRIRQILFNLLANAIAFSPQGGTGRLSAAPRRRHDRVHGRRRRRRHPARFHRLGLRPLRQPSARRSAAAASASACRSSRASSRSMAAPSISSPRKGSGVDRHRPLPARPGSTPRRPSRPPSAAQMLREAHPDMLIDLPDEAATAALAEDVAAVPRAGRSGGAVGRPRRRQDDLRPRADPRRRRRSGARGAEPDLHARPDLRCRAAADRPFRPLSPRPRPDELDEIGLDEALADGAVAGRVAGAGRRRACPPDRLDITFEIAGEGRRATIAGSPDAGRAASRGAAPSAPSSTAPAGHGAHGAISRATPRPAPTSASAKGERSAVLMDWPPRSRRRRCATRASAYRARDVRAFIAVDTALRDAGLSAPEIYAADTGRGFLLLEDLGTEGIVARRRTGSPSATVPPSTCWRDPRRTAPGRAAAPRRHRPSSCRRSRRRPSPPRWRCSSTGTSRMSPARPPRRRSADAFDALWRGHHRPPRPRREELGAPRRPLAQSALAPRTRGARPASAFIDFQDLMVGPSAYDVASLCQDARVTVPPELEARVRRPLCRAAAGCRSGLRRGRLRRGLCDSRRPARHQDPRRLRPARRSAPESRAISGTSPDCVNISHGALPIRCLVATRSGTRTHLPPPSTDSSDESAFAESPSVRNAP